MRGRGGAGDPATGQPGTSAAASAASPRPGLADPALPAYERVSGVSGSIKSVGSDTMNNLMTLWAEGFKGYYPSVRADRRQGLVDRSAGADRGHGDVRADEP